MKSANSEIMKTIKSSIRNNEFPFFTEVEHLIQSIASRYRVKKISDQEERFQSVCRFNECSLVNTVSYTLFSFELSILNLLYSFRNFSGQKSCIKPGILLRVKKNSYK